MKIYSIERDSMTPEFDIAILLPTRGRTEALTRSLIGLLEKANNLDRIQVLLGLDTDDQTGLDHFENELQPKLDELGVAYTAMSFEPLGYGRLNEYINVLAKNSSAHWMFFWNDDAVMESNGWDTEITQHTGEFKLLAVHTHKDHPYSIFPIVPRAWLDIIGHLSLHSMTDAWLSQIAFMINVWKRIDVHVLHDRADLTGNNLDQTYKQRQLFEGNPRDPRDFHYPQNTIQRMHECDQLTEYMNSQGLDTAWWENVKLNKQDPWEMLRANDPNQQMRQFTMQGLST
jgi:hypothetical protein